MESKSLTISISDSELVAFLINALVVRVESNNLEDLKELRSLFLARLKEFCICRKYRLSEVIVSVNQTAPFYIYPNCGEVYSIGIKNYKGQVLETDQQLRPPFGEQLLISK